MQTHLHLEPAHLAKPEALLEFERVNRQHFERWINGRGDGFYNLEHVSLHLQQAAEAWQKDEAYQYLAWSGDELIGRFNLIHVQRPFFNKAMLGYRIAEAHQGKGLASAAVAQLLRKAFTSHNLSRLEATVLPSNLGSVRVLQKNGFRQYGRATRSLKLSEQWHDLLLFECHAESAEAARPHNQAIQS